MLNRRTFTFKNRKYSYELDGYKPLDVVNENTGCDADSLEVYEAAALDAAEYLQSKRDQGRDQLKEALYS